MTFSICARVESTDTAEPTFATAVATEAPAVGALAPCVSQRGAISTQSFVNVRLGRRGVALLTDVGIGDALEGLLSQDDRSDLRQVHGVDARGNAFAYSGENCDGWFGHRVRDEQGLTAAGNMLVSGDTLDAAIEAFETTDSTVGERLLAALESGRDAGGDKRGHRSAAILIKAPKTTAYHDLRVDHHETPIDELGRVYEAAREASDGFSEDSKSRVFD